jgi:hypothetical protein
MSITTIKPTRRNPKAFEPDDELVGVEVGCGLIGRGGGSSTVGVGEGGVSDWAGDVLTLIFIV